MRAREMQLLLKIAEDLHKLATENHNWCIENRGTRSDELLHMKSGQASAYVDAAQRILNFIKANERSPN